MYTNITIYMNLKKGSITDAEPAVTNPSFWKTGFSLVRVSIVVCGRGCSSILTTASCFLIFSCTGAISSLKRPASLAVIC